MNYSSKIYIAGHNGMVGSAIVRKLKSLGFKNLIFRNRTELDLLSQKNVETFFKNERPEVVFLAAAKVGGIMANNTYRAEFLYENLSIQNNVINSSYLYDVNKLIFLGSACIYPKDCKQPIKEEELLNGYLEKTNEPYAIAKISGIKLCESYFSQYKKDFFSLMPNNLYGQNDNFNLQTSHVLPALLRKFDDAKKQKNPSVEVWGSGNPLREFLHVDDLADACIFAMKNISGIDIYENGISHINVGSGEEISIISLAELIKKIVNYEGSILFNKNYPDGMMRKYVDSSRINKFGWESKISLKKGIEKLYRWYKETTR